MRAVPEATVMRLTATDRQSRYRRDQFETVDIRPLRIGDFVLQRFPGHDAPMISAVLDHPADLLRIWVFESPELSSTAS